MDGSISIVNPSQVSRHYVRGLVTAPRLGQYERGQPAPTCALITCTNQCMLQSAEDPNASKPYSLFCNGSCRKWKCLDPRCAAKVKDPADSAKLYQKAVQQQWNRHLYCVAHMRAEPGERDGQEQEAPTLDLASRRELLQKADAMWDAADQADEALQATEIFLAALAGLPDPGTGGLQAQPTLLDAPHQHSENYTRSRPSQ